jgi:hypothetical protein
MDLKTGAVIFCTTLGLAVGANELLSVETPDGYQKYRQQQIVEQGSDAVEMENDRKRDRLRDSIDAENNRKLTPSEVRPAEPKVPQLRIRP